MQLDAMLCNSVQYDGPLLDIEGAGWEVYTLDFVPDRISVSVALVLMLNSEDPADPDARIEFKLTDPTGQVLYEAMFRVTFSHEPGNIRVHTFPQRIDGIDIHNFGWHRFDVVLNGKLERTCLFDVQETLIEEEA